MLGPSAAPSPASMQQHSDAAAHARAVEEQAREDAAVAGGDPDTALLWLQQFASTSIAAKRHGDHATYQRLLALVQRADTQLTQQRWLAVFKLCVSLLTEEHAELVRALLRFDWTASATLAELFQEFSLLLLSANACYTHAVLDTLVARWIAHASTLPAESYDAIAEVVHETLQHVLVIVPTSPTALLAVIAASYPHRRHDVVLQTRWLAQVLRVIEYAPVLQEKLLALVVQHILLVDVEIKLDDEDDAAQFIMDGTNEAQDEMAEKLDAMLVLCFRWLRGRDAEAHGAGAAASLTRGTGISASASSLPGSQGSLVTAAAAADEAFPALLSVFHASVLSTYRSKYTQFLVLVACATQPEAHSNVFVTGLVERIASPSETHLSRVAAAAYLGGFLSRAAFVPAATIHASLDVMFAWLHEYVDAVDANVRLPDPFTHPVFYATCQAVLYTLCFRHAQLQQHLVAVNAWPGALDVWRLPRLLACNLNPLRVCLPTVVREFVNVLDTLGLHQAGARAVLARNAYVRVLPPPSAGAAMPLEWDAFFPFDPILLRDSASFVRPLYYEWGGADGDEDDLDELDEDDLATEVEDEDDDDAAAGDEHKHHQRGLPVPYDSDEEDEEDPDMMGFTPDVESDLAFHHRLDARGADQRRRSSALTASSAHSLGKSPGFSSSPLMSRKGTGSRRGPGERLSSLAP